MGAVWRRSLILTLCGGLCVASIEASPSGVPEQGPADAARQVQLQFKAAEEAERQGDSIRAESEFRQALGESLIQLGLIDHTLGDLDQAELAYREATEATANSDVALLGLAVVYLRKGEFDKGVQTVKVLLAENPFNGGARYLLGKLDFSMGHFQAARGDLAEAFRTDPSNLGVAYTLAMTDLKLKDPPAAQKIFQQMLAQLGDSPKLHIAFAAAYRQTEHYDLAIEQLEKALAMDPTYPKLHYYLAVTYLPSLGRKGFPQAIREFRLELRYHPRDYESNYLLGMLYVEEHQMKDAAPFLEAAVHIKPDSPDAPLYLGQTYELLGRYTEAIPLLRRSIELTRDPSRNNYQIGNAHYLLGQALLRTSHADGAKQHFAAADRFKNMQAAKTEKSLQTYLGLTRANDNEDVSESLNGMQGKAIIVAPPPPTPEQQARLRKGAEFYAVAAAKTYMELGLLHARQSDFKKAADDFEKALQWDSGLPDLAYNLGLAQFKSGDFAKAIPPLLKVREDPAKARSARALLGMSYFFIQDYQNAVEQIQPLMAEGVRDSELTYAWGLSLAHVGRRKEGEQALRGLLEKEPHIANVHQALGEALAMDGEYAEAGAQFQDALKLEPDLPQGHYDLGLALLRQSKFNEAESQFQQAAAQDPSSAHAQFHLGLTLSYMEHLDDALQHLQTATQLNPGYGDAYYEIGIIHMRQGHAKEALAALENAAQLEGNKSYVQYELSQAYIRMGQRQAAQLAISRYRELKAQERKTRNLGSNPHSAENGLRPN